MKYAKLDDFMLKISATEFSRKVRLNFDDALNMQRWMLISKRRTPVFFLKIGTTRWGKIKAHRDKERAKKPNIWASLFKGE